MRVFLNVVLQAFEALRGNRLRTALSVAGIAFGVAAVIAVTTLSAGGNQLVRAELETFGLRSVWVYRDWQKTDEHRQGTGIDNDDLRAITQLRPRSVDKISPVVRHQYQRRPEVSRGNKNIRTQLTGVGADYADIVNDHIARGRNLNQHDIDSAAAVAVIGPSVARALWPAEQALGSEFFYAGHRFRVIGVLAAKSRDFLASIGSSGGQDTNTRLLLPYSLVQNLNGDRAINTLHLRASDMASADAAAEFVKTLLTSRARQRYLFSADTMAQHIVTADRILNGVAIVGLISACISLLVGGIGIASIMGTAVVERTAEIGLRRAVGARRRDIMHQFIVEAALISLMGGLLGLLVGGAASVILAQQTQWPLLPSLGAIIGALTVALCTGLLAGYLPARRAARLRPVEALRAA